MSDKNQIDAKWIKHNIGEVIKEQFKTAFKLGEPLIFPWPCFPPVSGLYERKSYKIQPIPQPIPEPIPYPVPQPIPIHQPSPGPVPVPGPVPGPKQPVSPNQQSHLESVPRNFYLPLYFREELRLDIDRYHPQMTASGTIYRIFDPLHWIADLITTPTGWSGTIWFKDGNTTSFPYTNIAITVTKSWLPTQRTATVTFSGGGTNPIIRSFKFKSWYFHPIDFEFDFAEDEEATIQYDTCSHPNRPASLPCENLSIQDVYRRTGFEVKTTTGGEVPISGAGSDARWSDQEMHDAMQTYWSHFADRPQWAFWVFFASLHENGTSLGGIMFDDIGLHHRQGTSIFNDSFISDPPVGEPLADRAAWTRRNIFWTACHEMGHAFNLAHSWQKSWGQPWGTPWIPLADEPEARSFMNYPNNVNGGQQAFFSDFEFRFSDEELLFLRHGPARFVQPGNADWFDNHGFRGAEISQDPSFKLELRVNRENVSYEFMEPVVIELKLTNITSENQIIDENVLKSSDSMIIIIKQDGKPARQFATYARYLWRPQRKLLASTKSVYESHNISVGLNGWDLSQAGFHTIQVLLKVKKETIVSNPLKLYITPPRTWDEENFGRRLFTSEIGRIFAFKGSQFFKEGNKTLQAIVDKLPNLKIAFHANYVLGSSVARDYKQLIPSDNEKSVFRINIIPSEPVKARKLIATALLDKPKDSIESFGHVQFKRHVDQYSDWLYDVQKDPSEAKNAQQILLDTMEVRKVRDRPILPKVITKIKEKRDLFASKA